MEDSGTESHVDYNGLAQEASEGKNSRKWPRKCCDILEKDVAAFCSCLKQSAWD